MTATAARKLVNLAIRQTERAERAKIAAMDLATYFDRVVLVNLDRRPERLAAVAAEMARRRNAKFPLAAELAAFSARESIAHRLFAVAKKERTIGGVTHYFLAVDRRCPQCEADRAIERLAARVLDEDCAGRTAA